MPAIPFDQLPDNKQIAVLHKLAYPDHTYAQISKAVGVSMATLNVWKLNTLADSYRKELLQLVQARIEQAMLKAVNKLEEQVEDKDERIAQNAAIKLLEWGIGKPTQKTENLNKTIHAIAIVKTAMDVDRL
jgi:hypothetical protein